MNSDFAGSSSHDDRRRRRLLSEQTISDENAAVVFMSGRPESSRNHRYPVKRIIHYRAWKIWVTSMALLICGGGLLYGAWAEQHHDLGAGFSTVFDSESGRVFPVVGAGLLFLCGQLSWLIGWARSRSLTDYSGTFRVWKYIGLFLFASSFGVLIGADRVLNETLGFAKVELPWDIAALNWMIPAGSITLILLWFCDREMRTSRLGRSHLWGSLGLIGSGLGLPLLPQVAIPTLWTQGLILGGLIGLLTSMMWFARHVFYFSAEPVAQSKRIGLTAGFLDSWRQRRAEKSAARAEKKAINLERKREKAEQAAARRSAEQPATNKRRRGSRRKAENDQPRKSQKAAPPESKQVEQSKPVERPQIVKLNAAELSVSGVDEEILNERIELMELLASEGEPFDLEVLKGLTKKQKKRLRNYWRELERFYEIRKAG